MKRLILILAIACLLMATGCWHKVMYVIENGYPASRHSGWVIYNADGVPVVGSYSEPHGGPIVVAKPRKDYQPTYGPMVTP